jgi:hypothetical protein
MRTPVDTLPVPHVEDLVRALAKGLRAFQMYLPNNPMYQRAAEALREAFRPVFEVLEEVTLLVGEHDMTWDEHVVYHQDQRAESFAWGLYKDGMRLLTFRPGCETDEAERFLRTVARARLLPPDASDDLLTLLWGQDFQRIAYQFAEVVTDPWVHDPQAVEQERPPEPNPSAVAAQVREEVRQARPEGMVDPGEFDTTLYFLDEAEIADFRRQVAEEYTRDVEGAALAILFDVFELEATEAIRQEILEILDRLFPVLLAKHDFRAVAVILRELRTIGGRLPDLDAALRERLSGLAARLSEPGTIAELLRALDDAEAPAPAADLAEVLRELRAPALGAILAGLPQLASEQIREMVAAAAERLAGAHADEVARLLGGLPADALPWAARLAGRLGLAPTVPALVALTRHDEPNVRRAAVEALAALGTPQAMSAIESRLEDHDRAVRAAALAVITKRSAPGAMRRLEAIVLGRSSLALERAERRAFFEAYAVAAGPEALDLLRGVLFPRGLFKRRPDAETRTCAVYAVGRLRTPAARTLLEELGSDKDLPVRHAAASLLREWSR